MLRNRLYFALLIGLLALNACSEESILVKDKYSRAVLEYAIGDEATPAAAVGVIDGLYEINKRSPRKLEIFTKLLDYYLGSSGDAVLNELITKNGKVILPYLRQKLSSPVICHARYKSICIDSADDRDAQIRRLIKAIKSGVVLCVDKSNC